jgi:hypothetical protein
MTVTTWDEFPAARSQEGQTNMNEPHKICCGMKLAGAISVIARLKRMPLGLPGGSKYNPLGWQQLVDTTHSNMY